MASPAKKKNAVAQLADKANLLTQAALLKATKTQIKEMQLAQVFDSPNHL